MLLRDLTNSVVYVSKQVERNSSLLVAANEKLNMLIGMVASMAGNSAAGPSRPSGFANAAAASDAAASAMAMDALRTPPTRKWLTAAAAGVAAEIAGAAAQLESLGTEVRVHTRFVAQHYLQTALQ